METAEFAAVGVTSLLEAVRAVDPAIRVYQASSSEIFGEPADVPQTESTPLAPVTPYGVAKAYGHLIVALVPPPLRAARELRDPLQPRVAAAAASTSCRARSRPGRRSSRSGGEQELLLGDLDAERDWGYAGDYVEAMWLMLQQDEPGDYVIASGELHTVRDLAERAFAHVGLDWREHVRVDETLAARPRPSCTGSSATPRRRGRCSAGSPRVGFDELVRLLVDAAVARLTTP